MHYHPTNDYPINLEHVFKLIGFANKGNAKRTLENNFIKDEDYKLTILPSEKGQIHLGVFNTELEAAQEYNTKTIELNNVSNEQYKVNVLQN